MGGLVVFLTPNFSVNIFFAEHFSESLFASTRCGLTGRDHRSLFACTNGEHVEEAAHTLALISLAGVIDNAILCGI